MSSANPSSKAQRDRLVELEEQMLYLVEVSDSIRFLESRLEENAEKTDMIDAVAGRVEKLPIQELLPRVDTVEGTVGRTGSHERRDNVNARLSLTMRAMANQAPAWGAISVSRVKIPKPKPFYERDAKALENYIFDLEQYFRATNTVAEEAKVTLATMYLFEDAKLWWRSRMRDVIQVPHRGEIGTTAEVLPKLREGTNALMEIVGPINRILKTPSEDQASLTSDSDDRLGQTKREVDQMEEVDNPRIEALKFLSSLPKKVG
ncbi:senescence-specific cysteine protease sag39 [Cucumis melo var. makuwa]|uniref:Senescence-specific cysteine protease sag39 n=1 Tax=Cucumis melo var. makuwa TaxID=1194695 RepID=A0A5D3DAW9_CUCMM|nr:senescence-specific cysteine protease sag39 [Cucumis melo var. makuwa]TYK20742.1 senescence-specific cysteine protease sag39 [Cucumis melo var. makuwa]